MEERLHSGWNFMHTLNQVPLVDYIISIEVWGATYKEYKNLMYSYSCTPIGRVARWTAVATSHQGLRVQ